MVPNPVSGKPGIGESWQIMEKSSKSVNGKSPEAQGRWIQRTNKARS
jgi:hypothetical protein